MRSVVPRLALGPSGAGRPSRPLRGSLQGVVTPSRVARPRPRQGQQAPSEAGCRHAAAMLPRAGRPWRADRAHSKAIPHTLTPVGQKSRPIPPIAGSWPWPALALSVALRRGGRGRRDKHCFHGDWYCPRPYRRHTATRREGRRPLAEDVRTSPRHTTPPSTATRSARRYVLIPFDSVLWLADAPRPAPCRPHADTKAGREEGAGERLKDEGVGWGQCVWLRARSVAARGREGEGASGWRGGADGNETPTRLV